MTSCSFCFHVVFAEQARPACHAFDMFTAFQRFELKAPTFMCTRVRSRSGIAVLLAANGWHLVLGLSTGATSRGMLTPCLCNITAFALFLDSLGVSTHLSSPSSPDTEVSLSSRSKLRLGSTPILHSAETWRRTLCRCRRQPSGGWRLDRWVVPTRSWWNPPNRLHSIQFIRLYGGTWPCGTSHAQVEDTTDLLLKGVRAPERPMPNPCLNVCSAKDERVDLKGFALRAGELLAVGLSHHRGARSKTSKTEPSYEVPLEENGNHQQKRHELTTCVSL